MRAEVAAATGCTASAGIGPNLLLARLATKRAKPNGQYAVGGAEARAMLAVRSSCCSHCMRAARMALGLHAGFEVAVLREAKRRGNRLPRPCSSCRQRKGLRVHAARSQPPKAHFPCCSAARRQHRCCCIARRTASMARCPKVRTLLGGPAQGLGGTSAVASGVE